MHVKKNILHSGRKCTISGEWAVLNVISTTVCLSKGEQVPEYCGKKVDWILESTG